jgi:hypothetical protein
MDKEEDRKTGLWIKENIVRDDKDFISWARNGLWQSLDDKIATIIKDGRRYEISAILRERPELWSGDKTVHLTLEAKILLCDPREAEIGEMIVPPSITALPARDKFKNQEKTAESGILNERVFERESFGWRRIT